VGEEAHRTSVRNGHYDLPAWSDGYAALFPSLVAGRVETRDALWRIFAMKECRSPAASRAQEASPSRNRRRRPKMSAMR
jgi:hypothetical protein